METFIDTLPWKIFKTLKVKYPTKVILVTPQDLNTPGVMLAYSGPEEYVTALFRREGFEVYRYRHDYKSLEGTDPKMGLVFMANDSVIVPGLEVWGLVGHNIRPLAEGESKHSDAPEARN